MSQFNSINIRPSVSVLSVLPHLNYKHWFALAEFVDNSIQSSIEKKEQLKSVEGKNYKLRVDIKFDSTSNIILIKDNAGGISDKDYERAFRPAEIPPDASGLSEFGMGMKSAACWFSPLWSVRSTALGEHVERTIIFNIDEIVNDSIEELNVVSNSIAENKHYTELRLEKIRKFPRGNTIKKIREHLASIYRIYIQEGALELYIDNEKLSYQTPKILLAPYYLAQEKEPIEWKKEIYLDLGEGKSASGFVAIREKGNTKLAGFSLFRRKRLILGSVDETYRPQDIFGSSNTFIYQRLFGEIHLRGFSVSHTKDGIQWEENEEKFLQLLRKDLTKKEFPILQQAREFRSKASIKETRNDASKALKRTASNLKGIDLSASKGFLGVVQQETESMQKKELQSKVETLPTLNANDIEQTEFRLAFRDESWVVVIELSYLDDDSDWLLVQSAPSICDPEPRQITLRVSMLHPFMAQFPTMDSDNFTTVLSFAAAMGLAEVVTSELNDKHPSAVRRYTNEILKNHMSTRIIND